MPESRVQEAEPHRPGRASGSALRRPRQGGSELNIPHVVAWAPAPEDGGLPHGRDTTRLLASEVVHLRMKLEERRAIEAQKKKMEAAFTRQRQRRWGGAGLPHVVKKGRQVSPLREEAAGAEDEGIHGAAAEGAAEEANGPRQVPADPRRAPESPAR